MTKSNKSKWFLGITGTALSAFVISQIGTNQTDNSGTANSIITTSMSKEEKELVHLDWSNYDINGAAVMEGAVQSDSQTRRS